MNKTANRILNDNIQINLENFKKYSVDEVGIFNLDESNDFFIDQSSGGYTNYIAYKPDQNQTFRFERFSGIDYLQPNQDNLICVRFYKNFVDQVRGRYVKIDPSYNGPIFLEFDENCHLKDNEYVTEQVMLNISFEEKIELMTKDAESEEFAGENERIFANAFWLDGELHLLNYDDSKRCDLNLPINRNKRKHEIKFGYVDDQGRKFFSSKSRVCVFEVDDLEDLNEKFFMWIDNRDVKCKNVTRTIKENNRELSANIKLAAGIVAGVSAFVAIVIAAFVFNPVLFIALLSSASILICLAGYLCITGIREKFHTLNKKNIKRLKAQETKKSDSREIRQDIEKQVEIEPKPPQEQIKEQSKEQ